MTSSNATAPITMMGSTSTLLLSDDDTSHTDTLSNATSMDSTNGHTSLVNPSISSLTDTLSVSSLPSSILSTSTLSSTSSSSSASSSSSSSSTLYSSSSSYHTHRQGSSLYNTTTLLLSSYTNSTAIAYDSSSSSGSSSQDHVGSSSSYSSSSGSSLSSYPSSSDISYSSSYITVETSPYDSISEILITTTSTFVSAVPYYPEPTSYPESTTVVYTQAYCFTDSASTITTQLPVTATVDPDLVSYTPQATITTDFAYLANAVPGYKSLLSSNDDESSSKKTGTLAGSVVGSVAGLVIILFLFWFWLRRRKRSQDSIEKGFSHSIASTRRYDGSHYNNQEKNNSGSGSKLGLLSFLPFMSKTNSNSSSEHSSESTHSTGFGLSALRSTILHDHSPAVTNERTPIQQQQQSLYTRQPPARSTRPIPPPQPRTIDTVMEEPETSSSSPSTTFSKLKPPSYKTSRYQHAGLLPLSSENPFEDPLISRRVAPPVPPPSRRANAYPSSVDYHRHGVNRHSVASVESSIVSDDTDDVSSDESLILNGNLEAARNSGNTGFFKEIV